MVPKTAPGQWVLLFVLLLSVSTAYTQQPNEVAGARIGFADSVSFGPINVAMWAKAAVLDLDGDGGQDLLVSGGGFQGGGYLFRDPGLKNGKRIYPTGEEVQIEHTEFRAVPFYGESRSGLLFVQAGVLVYRPPARNNGSLFGRAEPVMGENDEPFQPGGQDIYPIRRGDRIDLLIGRKAGDYWPPGPSAWGDQAKKSGIGLYKSWDEEGDWRGGRSEGLFFYSRDVGSGKEHVYSEPVQLRTPEGNPILVNGNPSAVVADWDGDGDWDIVSGDFIDYLTYFENIGTFEKPVFRPGRKVQDLEGNVIHLPQNMTMTELTDWRGNGRVDLLVAQENGRLYFMEFRGLSGDGLPLFTPPEVILQENPVLETGIMAVPSALDWDRDGNTDIVAGNAGGYVEWFRNLGSDQDPVFDLPRRLESGGYPLRVQAGYHGSIQGPNEKTWGYTCPCFTDWDGDGLPDLILCGVRGDHVFYRNTGGDILQELEKGRPIEVNGVPLRTRTRVRPVAVVLRDGELPSYVCLDDMGFLVLHERDLEDGITALETSRRILYSDGSKMKLDGEGGLEGRAKLATVDWDEDGDWDLLCGLKGNQPLAKPGGDNCKILYFENVGSRQEPVFERPRYLIDPATDKPFEFRDHSCAPFTVAFYGDSKPGLLVGTESGSMFYWSRPMFRIGDARIEPYQQ